MSDDDCVYWISFVNTEPPGNIFVIDEACYQDERWRCSRPATRRSYTRAGLSSRHPRSFGERLVVFEVFSFFFYIWEVLWFLIVTRVWTLRLEGSFFNTLFVYFTLESEICLLNLTMSVFIFFDLVILNHFGFSVYGVSICNESWLGT